MNPQYPQNNHYHTTQTQPGSSRYPILPPVQNPEFPLHPFPPEQYQYNPQGNPQNNPYNPQTGYIAPGNDGNRQSGQAPDVNSETLLDAARMRELDRDLDSFFVRFYKIWLWLIVIGSAMSSTKYLIAYLSGNTSPRYSDLIFGSVIYGFWSLVQSVFGLQAIYQKSLDKANAACWMMTIYLVPSLIIEILGINIDIFCWQGVNWIGNYHPGPKDDDAPLWYGVMYFVLTCLTCHILAHVFVDINGAFRVRKILAEKSVLQEKLNESGDYDSFRA